MIKRLVKFCLIIVIPCLPLYDMRLFGLVRMLFVGQYVGTNITTWVKCCYIRRTFEPRHAKRNVVAPWKPSTWQMRLNQRFEIVFVPEVHSSKSKDLRIFKYHIHPSFGRRLSVKNFRRGAKNVPDPGRVAPRVPLLMYCYPFCFSSGQPLIASNGFTRNWWLTL